MAGSSTHEAADNLHTGEREVSDRVENLVADELIGEALKIRIDHGVAIDGERVLEGGATRETGSPQRIQLVHEAKCAGGRNVATERFAGKSPEQALRADRSRGEGNIEIEIERLSGHQRRGCAALRNVDLSRDSDRAARSGLITETCPLKQQQPGERIAVQNGRLWAVKHDDEIVDACARDGCHQMFDDSDACAVLRDDGAKTRFADAVIKSPDLPAAKIIAAKDDTRASRCRQKPCAHAGTRVQ